MKPVFIFAISLLGLASLSMSFSQQALLALWASLFFFFMAFNLLEASLPSLVSKLAPAGSKGTAMGIYSTSQFMGAFVGGVSGGLLMGEVGLSGVYVMVALLCLAWVLVAWSMSNPNPETGMTLTFRANYDEETAKALSFELSKVRGVEEVVAVPGENLAYLKVIKQKLDQNALNTVHRRFDSQCI